MRSVRSPRAALRRRRDAASAAFFWALRDVSFEVPRGSALGLIGANGAGKSTLLKILSRVTEPTAGQVQLRGRVGSLLEVGTGFHPELTGRENVLLNGAILGMKRAEILAKFDAIVAFAEIEPFIDTPVKHYSSGMYLRLAFAVAAHLEPEILLVDEVLAVGDASFQKRCLGKMNDVAREGRTVIFVSHNLQAIQRLCSHAVMLEAGQVAAFGDTSTVVGQYLVSRLPAAGAGRPNRRLGAPANRHRRGPVRLGLRTRTAAAVDEREHLPGRPAGVRAGDRIRRGARRAQPVGVPARAVRHEGAQRRYAAPRSDHLPSAGPQRG